MSGTADGRLRVIYLGHTAALSGGELGLARFIASSPDIEAHVILAEDGPLVAELIEAGATVEVLELDEGVRTIRREALGSYLPAIRAASSTLRYARRIAHRLRELEPDVVHTNTLKAGIYGVTAARLARRPVVWGLHDRIAPDYLPARAVSPMRWLVRVAPSGLIVPSQATLDEVGTPFRWRVKRAVIPLPVPIPQINYRVSEPVRTIGVIGRLAPWKGQDVFLQAFAAAFPEGDVTARVIGSAMFGEDDYAASLHELATSLGIAHRVEFTGFRSDIPAELASLDVLVNASVLAETLGQVLLEAMGAGVPVIAPRAGGPAEYIEEGASGLLHTPGDVESLTRAMLRLSEDLGLRQRLSANGRRVAEHFAPSEASPRLVAFYRKVLDKNSS